MSSAFKLNPEQSKAVEHGEGPLLMGAIMENLSGRKAEITTMNHHGDQVTIEALIPMRGLIGFETDLVNQTRGLGVISHLYHEYGPDRGEIAWRKTVRSSAWKTVRRWPTP